MASKKERLDVLLVDKGICTSRERAKTNIMAGLIFVDGQRVDKAGEKVSCLLYTSPSPRDTR